MKRLYRTPKDRILGGVCGGIGKYFDIDPVIIRLIWALFTFAVGFALILYIIAWIIIPKEPFIFKVDEKVEAKVEEEEEVKQ